MDKMVDFIRSSLHNILETAQNKGNICFIRCIPEDLIEEINRSNIREINEWSIYVISRDKKNDFFISSDQAVELRENKDKDIIFIIEDERSAGAGMDGIYSASREITENELYNGAISSASLELDKDLYEIIEKAKKKAKMISNHQTYTLYLDLLVRSRCVQDPPNSGYYLTYFGYWPIDLNKNKKDIDFELSSQVVQRLFFNFNHLTTRQKVNSLLVKEEHYEKELISYLESEGGNFWKDTLKNLKDRRDLWLNNIDPKFLDHDVKEIKVLPWRSKSGKPKSFSGLELYGDEDILCYKISSNTVKQKPLTVKWKTEPAIKKNDIVSYEVNIIYGHNDVFISKQVNHRSANEQKCSFTRDDFKDAELLDKTGKYDNAKIVVSIAGGEVEPKETEEFIILVGEQGASGGLSGAKKTRALVEKAVELDHDNFIDAVNCKCYYSKSHIVFRYKSKAGKIHNPELVKKIEAQIKDSNYNMIGRWRLNIRDDGTWIDSDPMFIAFDAHSGLRDVICDFNR